MLDTIGLRDISFKDKKALVSSACTMYRKFNAMKEFISEKQAVANSAISKEHLAEMGKANFKSISLFETLLNLLSEDYALIIQREFIEEGKDSYWYEDHWSRSTFFKVKKEAVDAFLFLFYV